MQSLHLWTGAPSLLHSRVAARCRTRLWKYTVVMPTFQLEDKGCSSMKMWVVKQELSCTQLVGDRLW